MSDAAKPYHKSVLNSSDWIALVALIVSLSASAFSFYQWRVSERESKVNATIEITNRYLEDDHVKAAMDELRPESGPPNEFVPRLFARLDYIAQLITNEEIDPAYVPHRIMCDMKKVNLSSEKIYQSLEKDRLGSFKLDAIKRLVSADICPEISE